MQIGEQFRIQAAAVFSVMLLFMLLTAPVQAQASGTIEGLAWEDTNGNGIQDESPLVGLPGVTVALFGANDTIRTAVTGPDGRYMFSDVAPGSYDIAFTPLDQTAFSPRTADSDVDANGRTGAFTIDVSGTSSPITVNPTPTDTYLTNPGIGWQDQPVGIDPPLLPETVAYAVRGDIPWDVLHTGPDTYNWAPIDDRLAQAVSEGKQFSFRVYSMRGEGFGGHQVPQWALDRGVVLTDTGEPDYGSCIYQDEWGRFAEALRQRYDGNPDIAYVDVSGYGNFNEWNWGTQTQWENDWRNPTTTDGHARNRLIDTFFGGSQTTHLCEALDGRLRTVSYSYPGWQQTQLIMPFAGIRQATYYAVDKRSDVGFRFDCLGQPDAINTVLDRVGPELANIWRTAPVVYEMCGGALNWDEAATLLRYSHGSLVHDNATEGAQQAEDLLRYAGYRYLLTEATFNDAAAPGGDYTVQMQWQNVGYAPSYPSMGQTFQLTTLLLDGSGAVLAEGIANADIANWFPADDLDTGTPPTYSANAAMTIPASTPDGIYTLAVAMNDTRTGQPINLGMAGGTDAGRYPLGTVQVAAEGGSMPLLTFNAGYVPDQILALTTDTPNVIVMEGDSAFNTGTVSGADGVNLSASVGQVNFNGTDAWNWRYDSSDDLPTTAVTINGQNADGTSASTDFTLTVLNVAPVSGLVVSESVTITGDAITVALMNAVDPGADEVRYAIDCQDDGIFELENSLLNTPMLCVYSEPGLKTVRGIVSDDDGGSNVYTATVRVDGNVIVPTETPLPTETPSATATQTPVPTPDGLHISRFMLVDADTDVAMIELRDGMTLYTDAPLLPKSYNVQAVVSGGNAGSVVFSTGKTENVAPYALFGDSSGNYNGQPLTEGTYTVGAVPYSGNGGGGSAGTGLTVTFTVAAGSVPTITPSNTPEPPTNTPEPTQTLPPSATPEATASPTITPTVTPSSTSEPPTHTPEPTETLPPSATPQGLHVAALMLVDADTNTALFPLMDGAVYSTSDPALPTNFNVQAVVSGGQAGSVIFSGFNYQQENVAPYALFGDSSGNYNGQPVTVGSYNIVAVPYFGPNGTNGTGTPLNITFTVVSEPVEPSATPTATATFTPTATPTATFTPSHTPTFTPTFTPSATLTPSHTPENTATPTFTATFTPTFTPSHTPTPLPSATPTTPPPPPPTGPRITGLLLVDADTEAVIGPIAAGATLSLNDPAVPANFNIVAETVDAGSVTFSGMSFRNENVAPYALFGDYAGDYFGQPLGVGNYTVTAVAYAQQNKGGAASAPYTITFAVVP